MIITNVVRFSIISLRLYLCLFFQFILKRSENGKHLWIWTMNKIFTCCFSSSDVVISETCKYLLFIVLFFLSASQFYFTPTNYFPFDERNGRMQVLHNAVI